MSAGSLSSPVFDFTSLDYRSVVDDLVRFSQATFPEELWTDFNESNFGTGLLDNLGYATDLLAYTANAQNLETIPTTAIREQNFRNSAKSFDYALKSAAPSRGTERVFLDSSETYPFTISRHLQFATQDGTIFQPDADVAVGSFPVAGYVDVPITQGKESYNELIGTTNGLANQSFELKSPYLIDGTLTLQVGFDTHTAVQNFIAAGARDKVYVTHTNQDGETTVILGDDINGGIPSKGLQVRATYKTGGGITTNLAKETINRVYGTSDGSPIPAQITSVINPARVTAGASKQSLLSGQQNLPAAIKANDRACALPDYAAIAVREVPGVLKAFAVAGRPYGGAYPVNLYVVPNGGGEPSDSLRNLVIVRMKGKRSAGKRIRVLTPLYVDLLIESDTYVLQGSVAVDVRAAQIQILKTKYDMETVTFGQTFDLQEAYRDTSPDVLAGIKRVFYKTFTVKPYAARHTDRPTTGDGVVAPIIVNLDTVRRREWLVQVIAPIAPFECRRYKVVQRRLGTITSVTDSLVVDEVASYVGNELSEGGWKFRPRPDEGLPDFEITGNTTQSISTASGLLVYAEPDDPYVVEKLENSYGKILSKVVDLEEDDSIFSSFVPLMDSDDFEIGDWVTFSDNPLEAFQIAPFGLHSNGVTLTEPVALSGPVLMSYAWRSTDGSVAFSVVDGETEFVAGDEVYVDTYPRTGDIALRPENFPLLASKDLSINLVGGVK